MVSWSLAKSDGTLARCIKSVMLDGLDKYVPESRPTFDAQTIETGCIVDFMTVVRLVSMEDTNHLVN